MLNEIQAELRRLGARTVEASEVPAGNDRERVKLTVGARSCVVLAAGLLNSLRRLPDGAGTEAVVEEIQAAALRADAWASC